MRIVYRSKSATETRRIARIIAEELLKEKKPRKSAVVFALTGELGSGKTTFLQGFKQGLGVTTKTPSPTFLLARVYPLKKRRIILWHLDCYRIRSPKDIINLGFHDWISHPDHIVAIEWADKIRRYLPKHTIRIMFTHGIHPNERIIVIKNS